MPLSQETAKSVTDIVAYGGVTSPVWFWPILEVTSNVAVSVIPIVSLAWLFLRVIKFCMDWKNERDDRLAAKND